MHEIIVGLLAASTVFGAGVSFSRSVTANTDGSVRALSTFDGILNTVVKLQEGVVTGTDGTVTATGESLLYWVSSSIFPRAYVQYLSGSATADPDPESSTWELDIDQGVAFSAVFPAVISYDGELTLAKLGALINGLSIDYVSFLGVGLTSTVDLTTPTVENEPIRITLDRTGLNLMFSITNQTITDADGVKYYPNQAKLDITLDLTELTTAGLNLESGRKVALMGRLFAVAVSDASASVDASLNAGNTASLSNDLTFAPADASQYEGFFNWERTVTVTYKNGTVVEDVAVTALVVDDDALSVTAAALITSFDTALSGNLGGTFVSRTVFWTFEVDDVSEVASIYWDPELGAGPETSGASAAAMSAVSLMAVVMLAALSVLF